MEFFHPLQGIIGGLENLKFLCKEGPREKEIELMIDRVNNEYFRMGNLIKKMGELYSPSAGTKGKTNINSLIEDVLFFIRLEFDVKKIKLVEDFDAEIPIIEVVPDQIKQVILNLLQNAGESFSKNGLEIKITTTSKGSKIEIVVSDNGAGIPKTKIEHIFEPFHSTKKEGSGLGLTICNEIITSHGGRLEVQSWEGQGSKFKIILPKNGNESSDY